MAFRDALKKYREAQGYQAPTSNTSEEEEKKTGVKPTVSTETSFSDKLKRYREEAPAKSLDAWGHSAYALLEDVQNNTSKWHDETAYKSRYDQSQKLLALADSWRKQYSGNTEAISYIDSVVEAVTSAQSVAFSGHQFFSGFKDEEDYNFWDTHSTPEKRQAWYKEQQDKVEALKAEQKSGFKPGNQHRLTEIKEEIAAIETEMRKYERAQYNENGRFYGSKVVDDHYAVTQQPDFATTSAKRDYANPTQADLQAYDNSAMTANVVLGQGGYQDDDGNVYDSKGNLVKSGGGAGIQDKLGMYLQATDADKTAALTRHYGADSNVVYTYGSLIEEGDKGSWEYLNPDELGIYYTYLGESQEKAYRYLYDMKTELNRRQTLDEMGQWDKAYNDANFLEKIALNAATIPAKFVSNVFGTIENVGNTLVGNEINPYSAAHSGMHFSQSVRGNTAEELDKTNFKIPLIDFTLGDIYQTGMSRLDSALATGIFGGSGTIFLGMGAAQEEAYKLYQQGASAEQITLGAFAAGAAEVVFERIGFDSLVKIGDVDTIGKWIKYALAQGGVEALEETGTELTNIITNAVIMGQQSDLSALLEENDGDWGKVGLKLLQQTLQAAFGGFLGGFGAGTTEGGKSYVNTQAQYAQTGKDIKAADGGVKALQDLAMQVAGDSEGKFKDRLTKQAGKIGEKSSRVKVGRLYNDVTTANKVANTSANQADIAKSLERKGFNAETANDIAGALVAQYNGQELTEYQGKLLESVQHNSYVQEAISNIVTNQQSTMGQRQQNIRDFAQDVEDGHIAKRAGVSVDTVKKIREVGGKYIPKDETPTEGEHEISDDGKTHLKSDPSKTVNIKKIASINKGKIVFETDDGTVDASDVVYATEDEALIYEAIASVGDIINADDANRLVQGFSKAQGMSATVYARGVAQAYKYGYWGYSMADAENSETLSSALTVAQRNTAFAFGRVQRKNDVAKAQEEKAKFKEAAEKAGKVDQKGGVYFRNGKDVSDIDSYMEQAGTVLKDVQKVAIETMKNLSEALGIEFVVYESYVRDGKRYYIDENGNEVAGAPNGWYDTNTGKVYIDLHAGNKGQGIMLFTIAHELTHFIHQWSPAKFAKLADIVFAHGKMKGNVSALVAQKMLKGKTEAVAYEEVVADAMESILKSGRVMEMVADIKQQDRGLWQKICDWFKNLADYMKRVVAAYQGKNPDSVEGRMVAEMKGLIKQLEAVYAEALVDASENFTAAQAQFSTESIRGTADGAVPQSEVTTALTEGDSLKSERTEYEHLPKQMMSLPDGSGTLLDFIEGLTGKKIKGLSGKAINGYTGREVRAYAMGISGFSKTQIERVNKFMDTMSEFMQEAGVTYKFIGLQDVKDAKLHYTYNADGSIKSIVLSAMVKNGDYPVNFDLSSICKKRVAMSKLVDKLAKRGSLDNGTVKLTPANIFKINTVLKNAGYETACLGCFVESKRYNSLEWAKKFCNKWNAAVKKVNPNATYFGYGDDTFSEDSFTLEQAVKIDAAATKYITATKTERLANAPKQHQAKAEAGQPLVAGKVLVVDGKELNTFSKAARDRLAKSDTISDELKTKYLNCDVSTLNMADVEFLLENGILPGASLSNKQAVTEMVKSGEAYQHLLKPSDLLTDRGISKLEALPNFHGVLYGHYGSGTPKLMQSYTPYNSEIALLPARKNSDQSLAEYLYTIAGVRMQSFSDFQIQNIYDYLQMVADLAARKLPAHAYTKEISFAKLLGMTGIKVNLSVMFDIDPMVDKAHAGLTKLNKLVHRGEHAKVVLEDEHGKWVYNIGDYQTQKMFAEAYPDEAKRFLQSIGFGDAVKLQSSTGYSANCGIIGVGYSDLGIIAMLNDNRIRYIIPYHASSLPAEIKLATNIALGTDYTPYQNNMKIKEIVDRNGKKVDWSVKEAYKRLRSGQAVINELNEKIRTEGWVVSTTKAQNGHGSYGLYENLQETNDPRQTASNFMDWCIGNGTLPLFYQFASHENYYKLLYDFNVYDCVTEEYAPQQAVTNTYPTMVDGQVQPGNVTEGNFDAEYFKGTIDKQMAFMDEYSRNLDEDLDTLAEDLEEGTLLSVREEFYAEYDAWDGSNPNTLFVVGRTSDALKSIGMKDQEIKMHSGMIINKLNTHPEITRDIFRQVPELLEHPIIVQFSDAIDPATQKPKYDDSITVLGELFATVTEDGKDVEKPVLVAIKLLPTKKKSSVILDFAVVKSAYTKDALQQYLHENSILYIDPDKKRTDSWLSRTGLSLPVGENRYGSIRRIAYVDGKVKIQNPKNMTDMQRKLFEAGIIDEFGNKLNSDRDSDYLDAVNRGDMETVQRLVDEAAKVAGFTSPRLFHGTSKFGFTRFDPSLSYDRISVFLSNSKLIAQTYSGGSTGKSRVSEKASVTPDQLEKASPETVLKLLQDNIDKSIEMVSEQEHKQIIEKNREKVRNAIKQVEKLSAKWGIKKSSKEHLRKVISCLEAMVSASSYAELEKADSNFKSAKYALEYADGNVLAELHKLMGDNVDTAYKALTYYLDAALYRQRGKNAKLFNHNMAVSELYKTLFNGVYELYANPGKQFVFDANGANWSMIDGKHINASGRVSTTKVAQWAKENGYDSVCIKNLKDSGDNSYTGQSDVYIFFGGNRLKSADPVTYDDNGNVIPLSERFNTEKDDIRYSDRDTDGNQLTEDQVEYFENSQVRNRNGDLQVVYHGGTVEYEFDTTRGGKGNTQYGPGSYFTDSEYYAKEYTWYRGGNVRAYYLNIEKMFDDTNMDITSRSPEWQKLEQILRSNGIEDKFIERFKSDGFAYMSRYLALKAGAKTSSSWEGSEKLNAMLRDAGFQGIKGELNDSYQYVIFTPNQAKLTTNEVPSTFYDTRYSDRDYVAYDRTAILKEETVDRWLRAYATKSSPNYAQAYIAYMNPDQFLELTTSDYVARKRIESESYELDEEKFVKATSDQPLFLDIDHETGEVYGHEGRHRCVALQNAGIDEVPVLLFDTSNKYSKEDIPSILLKGQFNKYHREFVFDAIPLSYENHDRVIQNFATQSTSQRFWEKTGAKNTLRFQERSDDSVSNRSLLANAFETVTKDQVEYQAVQEYKSIVPLLDKEEQKLQRLNEEIKALSFGKGPRDTKKIRELRDEATKTANRISVYDGQLLRLEASAPLKKVLEREKKKAYQRAEQKGRVALADYKAKAEAKQKAALEEWRESRKTAVAKARESAEKRDARAKLQKLVMDTVNWISYPAKTDVKCPDILKPFYKDFLDSIDLSSKRLANGGDPTKNDLRLTSAMESLATALEKVMTSQDPTKDVDKVLDIGYLDLPADFVQKLRDMTEAIKGMMVEGDYVVNNMTAEEVRKLSQMIRTLNHAIKTMSNLYANLRFANIEALGVDTMEFMDALGEIEKTGGMKDFVQWDNALPYYAFKRFGKGGESVFEGLMDAQDKLAFLAKTIFDFQEKAWTAKEAKAWSEDTHTIELPDGDNLTLTTADAMSIYCLSRREQGLQHLLGGGTRVLGLQKGSKKAKDSRSLLTIKDIDAINSSLTDRQKQVAEAIQEFMSTVCSEWGNEISMKRFLTKEFTEKFYFPIESNDENLPVKDPAAQQSDLFRLLNISATKPLTPGANNEVIIRNIFDVFTGHASDMARLNAYGMGLLDYMKWLNYREKTSTDEGQIKVRGVRKSMQTAYGDAAMGYVLNLVKDVNGRASDGGEPNILMKWMRAAKTASVGSSLRVATLQITSYPRASLVLSPKSLALGLSKLPKIEMAKKYCGIALWKSFGFYDTNISRSIEDQMKGVKDVKQKLIELSLKGAELGDAITWGALWNACEYEVAATKEFKVGTEEFYQAVGKKLRDVVYRTQVVDSMLTRSQIMRSKRGTAQEAAAFMSEPTLSANILMDAGFEFDMEKRRNGTKSAWAQTGSYIGKAVAVYAIGQLTAALLEGLWDAWRDEEDEEFWKKYLSAFGENLLLDLVPFNKIPIVSDVFEAVLAMVGVGFYSSDKMSTTWITQAVSAVDAWKEVLGGESSMTAYNALYKSVRALSSFVGVSISGVMREGVALWNNTAGAYDSTLKIRTWEMSDADLAGQALKAITEGNTRQADSLKAKFPDEKTYQSAMRTAIKDSYAAGDINTDTATKYLVKYGGLEEDDAYWKVEEWKYEASTGEDFAKYDNFITAVETGKELKTVISKYTSNGVSKETLASQITSHFKPLYKQMSNYERASIKGYLLNAYEQLGYDRAKKSKDIDKWLED